MGEENKTTNSVRIGDSELTFGIPQCLRDVYGDDEGKIDCIRLSFFNEDFDNIQAIRTPRKGDLPPYKQFPTLEIKTLGSKKIKELRSGIPTEFIVLISECLSPLVQNCSIVFSVHEFAYVVTKVVLHQSPESMLEIMDEYLELPEPIVNPTDG